MSEPRVAFYGDDFTGSVDALLQLSRRGWTARLFVGLPAPERLRDAAKHSDAVGIAGIARSLPTDELEAELLPVFEALASLHPRILQYKACSTADSSPYIGSLGRVIELGRSVVPTATVPVLFAQPDFGRYTVFGHHFAAENGVVHRLDRQPTMSTHPSTPMDESDLALHLARQTALPIEHLPFTSYESAEAIAAILRESDAAAVVLDALNDEQLETIGTAILSLPAPLFALGSGGLSHALAAAAPGDSAALPTSTGSAGPILAVSGSRSAQTRRQIAAAGDVGWLVLPLPVPRVSDVIPAVLTALRSGRSVVLASDGLEQTSNGAPITLQGIADSAAEVVAAVAEEGASRRVVVCGGDTSSRVIRLLGVDSLSIAANPWANIVVLRAHADDDAIDGLELVLKGGQVGDDDFLVRLHALGE
ncbi:MAG: four-carbon acid sugar kinase family protein [Humibacter sp.]